MRQLIVVLLLSCYSIGNILLPYGDLSRLNEMYAQCATEDPDINAADFIVEHLLNLPDLFGYFEQDSDEEQERPHQPFHYTVPSAPVAVVVSKPIRFECRPIFTTRKIVAYPLLRNAHLPAGHLSGIFRPPIV